MRSFAIVLVCYNRIGGLRRLVSSLEKVDYDGRSDIELIFSIDNSGTNTVVEFAEQYQWPFGHKTIRTFPERQGLKKHIIQCGDYTDKYDIVVVLEDDIFVSDSLYHYASQAADYYWDDDRIAGISLYSFQKNWLKWLIRFEPQKSVSDTFFLKVAQSWGQVWTKNKWPQFKKWYLEHSVFDKSDKLPSALNGWPESSWLKYHDRYCIETGRYFVYPYVSLTTNYSDAGEHNTFTVTDHQVELQYGKNKYCFNSFSDESVTYDEFMEREHLAKYLGIPDDELTVDIWGNKPKKYYSRYVLTIDPLPYLVIRGFALALRPVELNIIVGNEGTEIKLYDTKKPGKTKKVNADFLRYQYSLRTHDYKLLTKISVEMCRQVYGDIKRKVKKILKK